MLKLIKYGLDKLIPFTTGKNIYAVGLNQKC